MPLSPGCPTWRPCSECTVLPSFRVRVFLCVCMCVVLPRVCASFGVLRTAMRTRCVFSSSEKLHYCPSFPSLPSAPSLHSIILSFLASPFLFQLLPFISFCFLLLAIPLISCPSFSFISCLLCLFVLPSILAFSASPFFHSVPVVPLRGRGERAKVNVRQLHNTPTSSTIACDLERGIACRITSSPPEVRPSNILPQRITCRKHLHSLSLFGCLHILLFSVAC
jgi:hypothetical protein